MIARLLEKIAVAILDVIAPVAKPVPAPVPPPTEEKPDPKQVALEMRALAGWIHAQADRLDPLTLPSFSTPPTDLLPPRWNTVLDEGGESGGIIKRKGSGIEMGATTKPIMDLDPDLDQDEILGHLRKP